MFRVGGAPDSDTETTLSRGLDLICQGIALLAGEDRSGWTGSDRAALVLELGEVSERLEAERVRAVGEWDAVTAWVADGALSAASWLATATPISRTRANQLVRTARLARRYERVGKALAAGDLPVPHAEILATATRGRDLLLRRDEDSLVELAPTLSVDDFTTAMKHWRSAADDEMASADAHLAFVERSVSYATTLYERVDLQMSLDAEGGATVIGALQAFDTGPDTAPDEGGPADGPRTLAQRYADAMVQLCAEALARRQAAGHPTPGIDGMIDVSLLGLGASGAPGLDEPEYFDVHGRPGGSEAPSAWDPTRHCHLDSVGPVALDVLVRLACDAAVGRIVMRGQSEVLDLGRRARIVPRALRRAIRRRDRGCVFPGCTAPVHWCDVHHLVPWADGGPTNLENCALLCRRHHVLCHEGGWRLARSPDGTVEIVQRGPGPRTRPPRPPGAGAPRPPGAGPPGTRAPTPGHHRAPSYDLAA